MRAARGRVPLGPPRAIAETPAVSRGRTRYPLMKTSLLALLVATANVLPAAAPADAAPKLVSRTGGGGGTWADLAELQASAAKLTSSSDVVSAARTSMPTARPWASRWTNTKSLMSSTGAGSHSPSTTEMNSAWARLSYSALMWRPPASRGL